MQLVHTEVVIPLSSEEGHVIGVFTVLADYWLLRSMAGSRRAAGSLAFIVTVFDHVGVNQDHRPWPDSDRILVAQLTGTARHHARWRELA
jgi:hypothetical protein